MFHLTIDGKNLTGSEGQTILDVARAGGIEIPTLCHDERLKPYGSCGICVVQLEGSDNLVRSCATAASDGMVVYTDNPRIRKSRQMTLELLLSDHDGDCRPPCSKACPAHTDCQGYVGLIANGKYSEATALIKEAIPVPLSIGLVCPHPCEDACRRQLVEEPIAIAALKSFAAWQDMNDLQPYQVSTKPATGKKVAIVGSGPAGLTAAFFLAKEGHQVTVYDAMPEFGGMLRYGIPEYRLPKKLLDKEIDNIRQLGVVFVPNTRVNSDISLEELHGKYDAVFLGIGAWTSSRIDCPGEDLPGVLGGIDFLRDVAMGRPVEIGSKVAIIGGGNTAMDAARTSVRLGASEVMVLYRRTRAEMPAEDLEIEEAMEEGVQFHFLVAPAEISAENGKVNAIRMQVMELGEPDKSGRRRPMPTGEEKIIAVDNIIAAIGQQVNTSGFEGLELTRWGSLAADESSFLTSLPGVFAGGDGVTGPGIAIEAVAQGKGAARAMIDYLAGKEMVYTKPYLAERQVSADDFAEKIREPRAKLKHADPVARRSNFELVSQVFDPDEAQREASRCLECGCMDYFECKLIKYAGEYQANPIRLAGAKHPVPVYGGHPYIIQDAGKCIFCSLCVRICDEVIGAASWGQVHRGFETMIQPELGLPLEITDCISCGECVNVCPTGALTARDPITKQVPLALTKTDTHCSQCSMACPQVIESYGSLQMRAVPPPGGLLCQRGRFEWKSDEKDEISRNALLPAVSWEEAAGTAVQLINKGGKWEQLADADVIFMVGSFKSSQVGAVRARAAAAGGARLVIISSEHTLVDDMAFQKISVVDNKDMWRQVLAAVLANGWYSAEYKQTHADRLSSMIIDMEGLTIGEQAVQLAEMYTRARKAMILVDGYSVDSETMGLIAEVVLMTESAESLGRIILVSSSAN
ncbi:MAG: FAD-dependent oxidoreductase [Syntrophomonadaceae bacterium]|nr:FAD-dependent oxidoreductase [Syntrophomonadaceae bacterium]